PRAGRHHHGVHRAGEPGRPASRQHRLPKHLRRRPGADADHAVLQRDRLLADPQVPGGVLMASVPENQLPAYLNPEVMRAGLSRRKLLDQVFVLVGLILMLSCLGILAVLFLDLVSDGASRFGWDFFTNFPSRRAERVGILGAWVGTSLIMLV